MYHAGALFFMREYDRALETIDGAIALDSEYAFAHMTRARILSEFELDEEALESVNRALEINPEYALGYAVRADVYKWLGEYELSIADIETSLELSPDNLFALESRVLTEYHFDNYGAAIDAGEYVLSIDPENTFILDELAESYRLIGECESALQYAEQGLAIDPEWWFMIRVKGNCQVSIGDSQAGIDTIMTIAQENVENIPFNYNTMLRGYYQLGDYASAVQMGKVSTDDNPEAPYSWRLYGLALLADGDIEGASEAIAQYSALQTDPDMQAFPLAYQSYIAYLLDADDVDAVTEAFFGAVTITNGEGELAPTEPVTIEMELNGMVLYALLEVKEGTSFTISASDVDGLYFVDPLVVVFDADGYVVALEDFGGQFSDVFFEFVAPTSGDYFVGILTDGDLYGATEISIE
jgi:tetratricopeptide (TPR) repeat protein